MCLSLDIFLPFLSAHHVVKKRPSTSQTNRVLSMVHSLEEVLVDDPACCSSSLEP